MMASIKTTGARLGLARVSQLMPPCVLHQHKAASFFLLLFADLASGVINTEVVKISGNILLTGNYFTRYILYIHIYCCHFLCRAVDASVGCRAA